MLLQYDEIASQLCVVVFGVCVCVCVLGGGGGLLEALPDENHFSN